MPVALIWTLFPVDRTNAVLQLYDYLVPFFIRGIGFAYTVNAACGCWIKLLSKKFSAICSLVDLFSRNGWFTRTGWSESFTPRSVSVCGRISWGWVDSIFGFACLLVFWIIVIISPTVWPVVASYPPPQTYYFLTRLWSANGCVPAQSYHVARFPFREVALSSTYW